MRLLRNLIGCSVPLLMSFSAAVTQSVQSDRHDQFRARRFRGGNGGDALNVSGLIRRAA
jgi:hypothetical protein